MADTMDVKLVYSLIDKAGREVEKAIKQTERLNKGVQKLDKNQKKAQKSTSKFGKALKDAFKGGGKSFDFLNNKIAGLVTGGAITGLFVKGAKSAMDFEQQMAEVSTLTDRSAKGFIQSFTPVVDQIRHTYGKNSQDTIKALYDGISAGVPATQKASKDFLFKFPE